MKIKITATITHETEIFPEDYDEDGLRGNADAVIAHELQGMYDEPGDSDLAHDLCWEGELSNIRIERLAEDAPAQEAAA